MSVLDTVTRLNADFLLNRYRLLIDGEYVTVAQFEGAELVLTEKGQELANALPETPQKTTRARKAAAVESPEAASEEAPQSDAPTE